MNYGIEGKVAFVGGSSQGLGRACAAALAEEGARVAVCGRRGDVLEAAVGTLREKTGREFLAVRADLAKAEELERALAETRSALGEIDILVTNTGGPRPGRFGDLQEKDWDHAYELLLKSAIRAVAAVLPGMRQRKWGRVIGITSVSVKEPIDTLVLSNVFRSGVTSLYKTLARDHAKEGVTFNTVLPGLTDTERLRQLYGAQAQGKGVSVDEFMAKMSQGLPLGRLNHPDELGRLVAFLASDVAAGITGTSIQVDGGQIRGLF